MHENWQRYLVEAERLRKRRAAEREELRQSQLRGLIIGLMILCAFAAAMGIRGIIGR